MQQRGLFGHDRGAIENVHSFPSLTKNLHIDAWSIIENGTYFREFPECTVDCLGAQRNHLEYDTQELAIRQVFPNSTFSIRPWIIHEKAIHQASHPSVIYTAGSVSVTMVHFFLGCLTDFNHFDTKLQSLTCKFVIEIGSNEVAIDRDNPEWPHIRH